MARLNLFETLPLFGSPLQIGGAVGQNTLAIWGFEVPGSLSFNNVQFIISQGNTNALATLSFGLYSLNDATLSLANSASRGNGLAANDMSWQTMATSATQDITPGNWWFAYIYSSSSSSNMSLLRNAPGAFSNGAYGGVFIGGNYSVTTNAFPASIATSDLVKHGGTSDAFTHIFPYILISA